MRQRKVVGSLALLALLALVGLIFGQTVAVHDGGSLPALRRIVPGQVELLPVPGSSGGDPWRLFDGDTSRGFVSQGEGPARIRLRLGGERTVSSVGIYGPAEGRLSVLAREDGVWMPILELDLRADSPGWRRWDLETPVSAAALLLEWQGVALPEVELWGSGAGSRVVQASEVQPGVFRLRMEADPGAFPRAYLSYELAGVAHWTGAVRSINGLPAQGGFAPAPGAGLQTEEINPRWLRRGVNEVRFFPTEEAPYTVRNLRLVLVEEDGRPAIEPSPLVDGDRATGWDGQTLDLPFHRPYQIHSLAIEAAGRPDGMLTVEGLLDGGGTTLLSTYGLTGSGRHELPVDEAPAVTGLRLSWSGAQEGGGQIVEAEILGSPVGSPRRVRPRLVLTHPLQGETAEGGAYLRGFVEPGRPELLVDGSTAEIQPDGAFGLFVPGPEEGSWEAVLEAAFPDGSRLSRTVLLGSEKEPSDPHSLTETQAAPGQAKTLSLGGARLEVGAGALSGPVKLSMRSLAVGDLPALDAGMTNVTPRRGGFRMGPHGLRFLAPVRLTLPYDAALLPAGMTADDVRTFYFDDETGRWFPIARLEAGAGSVVSATDHFTDFINATLALPDEPASADLAPDSMQELAKADPAAGIVRIEPPVGGSQGSARLDFPIVVPPGRQGLEPELAVRYDSDKANGWTGIGWDLSVPGVEVSTLFGVPRYDGGEEYLLAGDRLAAAGEPGRFVRRVEGSFQRIVRHGSRPDDFWWEVTEKDGTRYLYGQTGQARLRDYRSPRNTFRWLLERVIDLHGNTVDYTYATDSGGGAAIGGDGEPWTQVYPSRIDYTGVNGAGAYYQVRFFPEDGERPDPFSTGMPGFKVLTRQRLGRIDVTAGGSVVRSYRFEYHEPAADSFYKSLLASVAVSGEDDSELYRHTFDYFHMPTLGGEIDGFSEPVAWGSVAGTDDQSETSTLAGGGHAFVGVGDTACVNHAGVQLGGGGGATDTRLAFLDVNGDGLTDRIAEDGEVAFNRYDPEDGSGGFAGGTFPNAASLGHNDDWSFDLGLGGHLLNDLIVGGVSWTWSHSNDDRAVADLDGDGRPDLVASGSVRLNDGSGFGEDRSWSQGAGSFDLGIPGEEEQLLA
ncbi:MAG: SpvB/TcaC N-terminal domain-containing protein, partial [Thermoanaerobaculia bacterium]